METSTVVSSDLRLEIRQSTTEVRKELRRSMSRISRGTNRNSIGSDRVSS